MSETNFIYTNQNGVSEALYNNFLFVENTARLKSIKNFEKTKLCVIKTDFGKNDLKTIEKIKSENQDVEFWICSNNSSRKNILAANKIGINTVLACPFDISMIEEYLNSQQFPYLNNLSENNYSGLEGLKVMIVDDNVMNVELLEEVLSELNLRISSFTKPAQAMEFVLREKFDLFLLDIMMPEISGFDLIKIIKKTPLNQNAPIIFISALSDAQNKIKSYNLGSYAYIEKPFDINIVKSQIYNILKNHKIQEILSSDKETFLATVAHDLKTPIKAEINALNMLLDDKFDKMEVDKQEILEDILSSTRFMQDLVENLLCKNKIEQEKINLCKDFYCVKELVLHCIELTKYILLPKKQKINFKCKTEETLLFFDFLEMKRALHNLIANASEYSSEKDEILVEIFKEGNNLGLSVQDFGRGIKLEHQKDVFSQYMSLAKQQKTVGSGLGLYITKSIVEAHQGEILLDSKVGEGTKITIMLPIYTKV
ncbi:MAG TPA: hybrid sensor histidine kinase/response regulator [Candidatus Gastranaerophilaceae bacterium]|nr:hybrid sensor histidine kinase/response regulator [Candidatus Gastranaerophilaceae bacterium]HPT40973.1 hybrid sensor histidine kinase/response regulator [Candidatus Gastranaerophilaceae bacterium]